MRSPPALTPLEGPHLVQNPFLKCEGPWYAVCGALEGLGSAKLRAMVGWQRSSQGLNSALREGSLSRLSEPPPREHPSEPD